MSHAERPPPIRRSRARRWLQHLPYLSLALFLAAIAALVWLTREYDDDAQRATLISDVLWMEQNLRFNLDRNEIHLQEIGPELLAAPAPSAQTEARLASLLTPERGLARILWLSPEGRVLGAMPPLTPAPVAHRRVRRRGRAAGQRIQPAARARHRPRGVWSGASGPGRCPPLRGACAGVVGRGAGRHRGRRVFAVATW